MKQLFVTMTGKEKRAGFCLLGLGLLLAMILKKIGISEFFFLILIENLMFAGVLVLFKDFLLESLQVPFTGFGKIVKMALLGCIAVQLATLLTNDLAFFYLPRYFFYDDTGPHFLSAQSGFLSAAMDVHFPLTAVCWIFLLPVVTEVFHRGLIFGNLPFKSRTVACLTGTLLFAVLRTLFLANPQDPLYNLLNFLQYIPMGLVFTWIYCGTETIVTPILAHMMLNAVSVFLMR